MTAPSSLAVISPVENHRSMDQRHALRLEDKEHLETTDPALLSRKDESERKRGAR